MPDEKQNLAEVARKKRHLYLVEKLYGGKPLSTSEIVELERLEAGPLGPSVVATMEDVARLMDVSYRTVQRWKQDGMPVNREGYYDLKEIKKWYISRAEKDKTEFEESRAYWKDQIVRLQAALLDLDVKTRTGQLMPREEVDRGRLARIIAIKRAFLALPTVLAGRLAMKEAREIETILYKAISEIIDEFSGVRDGVQNIEEGSGDMEREGTPCMDEAAQDNGERLGGSVQISHTDNVS